MSEMTPNAPDERTLRRQLADFYHLVAYLGWSEIIFNHISVRLPGPEHHYLVNPFGLLYEDVTPENLIKVSVEGELVEGNGYEANPAGFALHGVIHANRPDVNCVAHVHTHAVSAVAMKQDGLSHDTFYGAQLSGRVAYHDFEGITLYDEERERMLASIGDKEVLILRNHGLAVCGASVPGTFMLLWLAQRAAEIQCMSQAMAGPDIGLDKAVRDRCSADGRRLAASSRFAEMVFAAAVRRMQMDPTIPSILKTGNHSTSGPR